MPLWELADEKRGMDFILLVVEPTTFESDPVVSSMDGWKRWSVFSLGYLPVGVWEGIVRMEPPF